LALPDRLELSTGITLYDTQGNPSHDETDIKISNDIWTEFVQYSNYVEGCGRFISFPNRQFNIRGIPAPRQVIAWRKLIRMMGVNKFCTLYFVLNYLKNKNSLFEDQFKQHFGNLDSLENIQVTFTCGYFSKFNGPKRERIMNFIIHDLLAKGAKVDIWTQDKTLSKEFKRKINTETDGSIPPKNWHIHWFPGRIDVHYTLAKNTENPSSSLLCMEMIHTEAHDFRLETYLTFDMLKSFGCDADKFVDVLNSYLKLNIPKRVLTFFNMAYNNE